MTHITCRLTAKNRDQLWKPTLGNGVWAAFTFFKILTNSVNGLFLGHLHNSPTVGSQAFEVADTYVWNTLPTDVAGASSLSTFRRLLNHFLFKQSYPDSIYWHCGPYSGCTTWLTEQRGALLKWRTDVVEELVCFCCVRFSFLPCQVKRLAWGNVSSEMT